MVPAVALASPQWPPSEALTRGSVANMTVVDGATWPTVIQQRVRDKQTVRLLVIDSSRWTDCTHLQCSV